MNIEDAILYAKEKLDIMKLSEEEQREYKTYLESLHDKASYYESTYLQGHKKGHEEGHKKGHEEGHEEGIKKEKFNTAKKLLNKGMSVMEVVDVTGLSEEEIEKL